MIRALSQYMTDEAVPRWKAILLGWEMIISGVVLGFFVSFGGRFFSEHPKVNDVTTGLIAYASIALGFCVAGLTISLTLPEPKFTLRLATHKTEVGTNAYSDLLFVFSWTAFAHWLAVLILFVVVLLVDGSSPLLPTARSLWRVWTTGLIAALCTYCLCQFLITLITLSQVGSVYVRFLSEHKSESAGS